MSTETIQGSLTMLSIQVLALSINSFLVIDRWLEMRGVVMKRMLMIR